MYVIGLSLQLFMLSQPQYSYSKVCVHECVCFKPSPVVMQYCVLPCMRVCLWCCWLCFMLCTCPTHQGSHCSQSSTSFALCTAMSPFFYLCIPPSTSPYDISAIIIGWQRVALPVCQLLDFSSGSSSFLFLFILFFFAIANWNNLTSESNNFFLEKLWIQQNLRAIWKQYIKERLTLESIHSYLHLLYTSSSR